MQFLLLALPLVIYLSLATLPKGRPAVVGLAVAGGLIAVGFLASPAAGSLLALALVGAGMAAIAQALRWALADRLAPRVYFALLGLLPLLVLFVLSLSIGA
jgi:hypothetical protein